MDEICEINLDGFGRTVPSRPAFSTPPSSLPLDYATRSLSTNLRPSRCSSHDALLLDCEIADCALLPRTFWAASGAPPRCALEKLAAAVFARHAGAASYDPAVSGAEWWVQVRPSPAGIGRHAVLRPDDGAEKNGIGWHWDKDEELRNLAGTFVHPHLSTVTYLTPHGAPTVVLDCRAGTHDGEPGGEPIATGAVSWPAAGKHLCFDGQSLHAAPVELRGEEPREQRIETGPATPAARNRRRRRVTFLVNVWLNYRPMGVAPFPATMLSKLSPPEIIPDDIFDTEAAPPPRTTLSLSDDAALDTLQKIVWPLGGCRSVRALEASLPVDVLRAGADVGTTVFLRLEGRRRIHFREEEEEEEERSVEKGEEATEKGEGESDASAKKQRV